LRYTRKKDRGNNEVKFRIESTDGEFLCDLDLKDLDVEKMVQYSMIRLQSDPNGITYNTPLTEKDITKLIEYAIISIMKDEIKKYKK